MGDFLRALLLIFIAEMGDKTQIMAMAFATKYRVNQILIGVAIGSFANHGIAILLGSLLNRFIPIEALQLVAGVLFISFGLLSLSIAEEEEAEQNLKKYGAIITVGIAFFLGELGDKTQLTAMTLATDANNPAFTLMGTVMGMVIVSSVGIFVGAKLGNKIPEHLIKFGAFLIFMFFGLNKIFTSPYVQSMGMTFMALLVCMLSALTIFRFMIFNRQLKEVSVSALKQKAQDLKVYRERILKNVNEMCKNCDVCKESKCLVGYMRELLSKKVDVKEIDYDFLEAIYDDHFDTCQAERILLLLKEYFDKYPEEHMVNIELINIEKVLNKIIEKSLAQL